MGAASRSFVRRPRRGDTYLQGLLRTIKASIARSEPEPTAGRSRTGRRPERTGRSGSRSSGGGEGLGHVTEVEDWPYVGLALYGLGTALARHGCRREAGPRGPSRLGGRR